MNTVVDEVLAGQPRYNIKDNGGTTLYSNVQIDLATNVTTAGTPLNKALFDSIQTDLNSRLLVSNKATPAEVIAGTNNTKYITPYGLNTLILLKNRVYTSSETNVQTDVIYTFTNNEVGRMSLNGWLNGRVQTGYDQVTASIGACVLSINYDNGSVARIAGSDNIATNKYDGFKIEIDFNTKQFYIKGKDYYWTNSGAQYTWHEIDRDTFYKFDSIENITIQGKYRGGAGAYMVGIYRDL